jgi:hypothetical protein
VVYIPTLSHPLGSIKDLLLPHPELVSSLPCLRGHNKTIFAEGKSFAVVLGSES